MHNTSLHAVIEKVQAQALVADQHWTVCIQGLEHEPLLLRLGSQREVSELTSELARLGYELLVDDPNPCDFVFALQLQPAGA